MKQTYKMIPHNVDYWNELEQETERNTAEANFQLLEDKVRKSSFLLYVQLNALVDELQKAGYKSKAFDRSRDFINNIDK